MKMHIKIIRLTPEAEIEMTPAETVGLFGGNVPFVLVRIDNSKVVKLYVGQVIPVGQQYRIINPFQRTLDVQIVLNASPNFTNQFRGIDKSDPRAIRYYISNEHVAVPTLYNGVFIFQTAGTSYVEIQSATDVDVEIVRDFGAAAIAAKPGHIITNTNNATHPDGSINGRVTILSGGYTWGAMNDWLVFDGRADQPVIVAKEATGWAGVLEKGTALFMRSVSSAYMEYSLTIIDCGVDNYDE